jgi:ADP-ribosyl-[dinitrogen reductase] hydrolase
MQYGRKRRGDRFTAHAIRQHGSQRLDRCYRLSSAPPPTLSGARLRATRLASLFPQASVYHLGARRGPVSKAQRVRGAVLGLLVGDAMGVPYEFHAPHELPSIDNIDMTPPPGFRRAHGVPPGTWSDDGAQALCLLESLLELGRLDIDDFVGRMLRWLKDGHMAVDARIFDVSAQTLSALRALKLGIPSREAAPRTPSGVNNGSLSRALPLALLEHGSDSKLVENAHLQSRVTHPHPRCEVSCALLCLWARYELDGRTDAWDSAYRRLLALYQNTVPFRWEPVFTEELIANYGPGQRAPLRGSADVVDCLRSAMVATKERTFERTVRVAVAFGRSAGTTGCIAGSIAGMRCGPDGIPERWIAALRGHDILDPVLQRLPGLTRRFSGAPR